MMQEDTIVAQATPPGYGAIAIIRVSGPLAKSILYTILHTDNLPRQGSLQAFYGENNELLDQGIVLFYQAPHSFTGEDCLELQGHGSPMMVDALISYLIKLGARLALPGEFSKRAFLNSKIDLTQAEAIADLIHAQSLQAAKLAIRSLQGCFSTVIHQLVDHLIHWRTQVEAMIDFSEEPLDPLPHQEMRLGLQTLCQQLATIQQQAQQGNLLREGITVIILGKPNVGKSSLLNYLSGHETAIVTPIPGTTRDLLREDILIDGLPIRLIDTAGLRKSHQLVEQEGIRRAYAEIEKTDLILYVLTTAMTTLDAETKQLLSTLKQPVILVRNKIDLTNEPATHQPAPPFHYVALSAKTGEGIPLLKQLIKSLCTHSVTTEGIFLARRRHLVALTTAQTYCQAALAQSKQEHAIELVAENLRQAQLSLNEITGEFTSDDLLGRIFSTFCIGK